MNGKPTNIIIDNNILYLNNELGTSSRGELSNDHMFLLAPDWNNLKGTLSQDGKELRWNNRTSWIKQ